MEVRKETSTVNPAGSPKLTKLAPEESYTHHDEKTPFENFENLTDKLLRVPKKEVDKLREREQARKRKQD